MAEPGWDCDAFGDCVVFCAASNPASPSSQAASEAKSPRQWTFPTRRSSAGGKYPAEQSLQEPLLAAEDQGPPAEAHPAKAASFLPPVDYHDVVVTLSVASKTKRSSASGSNEAKAAAAVAACCAAQPSRSPSLDTTHPHQLRDQGTPAASPASVKLASARSLTTPAAPGAPSTHALWAQRANSCSSPRGAAAAYPQLHAQGSLGRSNNEWWKRFSSSKLNEMALEEPEQHSREMRAVPWVGGAGPMCALVHGSPP